MANIFPVPAIAPNKVKQPESFVITIGSNMSAPVLSVPQITTYCLFPTNALLQQTDWEDKDCREAYMEACVEQDIAWQIKINRQKRSLSQRQLAKRLKTKQSSVARWEDPTYGRHSIPTLIKVANEFDCALLVRLIPYSKLAEITADTSDEAYTVLSYESEMKALHKP